MAWAKSKSIENKGILWVHRRARRRLSPELESGGRPLPPPLLRLCRIGACARLPRLRWSRKSPPGRSRRAGGRKAAARGGARASILGRRVRPRALAGLGLGHLDVVLFEYGASLQVQIDQCAVVAGQRGDFAGARGGEVALRLHDQEGGGGAQRVFLILGVEGLFLEDAALERRLVAGAGLNRGDPGILDAHADVLDLLLFGQFGLPDGERIADIVGLRAAIAERGRQGQRQGVVREVAAEDLPEQRALAAEEVRIHLLHDRRAVVGLRV